MGVYETIGLIWVLFTSAFATIAFFLCAYVGLRVMLSAEGDEARVKMKVLRVLLKDDSEVQVRIPTNFR